MASNKYQIVEEDYNNVDLTFHNSYDTTKEYSKQIESFTKAFSQKQTILNIGGTVAECSYFADKGLQVTDIDISQAMLDHISESDDRIELVHGSIKDYGGKKFDCIWACRSLVHIPPEDFSLTLRNIRKLLAEGGVFGCVMFTTQGINPKEEYLPEPNTTQKNITYYRTLYSIDGLKSSFKELGFSISKQQTCVDKDGEPSIYFELSCID